LLTAADYDTKKLVMISHKVRSSHDIQFLRETKEELIRMLEDVIDDLDRDRIHPEGFNFFSFTWNVAYNTLKEQEENVQKGMRTA